MGMSKLTEKPPLNDFINTLPSPLLVALTGLAPSIYRVRRFLEVVSWKSSWEDTWLALGIWWAACLFSDIALRYALPLAVFSLYILTRWRTPKDAVLLAVLSEDTLHQAITDLTIIHSLLPSLALPTSWNTLTLRPILRATAVLYIPYLFLTYSFRLRVLVALSGTVLFTWRARWALLIRRAFWRSAYIRWSVYYSWSRISGQPIPHRAASPPNNQGAVTAVSAQNDAGSGTQPGHTLRFLFTIYENQRWWMGLDFTAALLPGERPSWCTASQQPVSPPAAFSLPAPTTVYMPNPERKDGGRIKRTARWTWEEPEWRVVVKREGAGVTRVERPLPSLVEEGASAQAGRILKGVSKMRQASMSSDAGGGSPERQKDSNQDSESRSGEEVEEEEPCTDADGWVFGDNKWEGGSAKGGMGKYTRYRRWTRIAVLTETVEHVGPGTLGIQRNSVSCITPVATEHDRPSLKSPPASVDTPPLTPAEDDGARLRQRLKAAVTGTSHP